MLMFGWWCYKIYNKIQTVRIQRIFKKNFVLISMYTWYIVNIWYTIDFHVVTIDN
jgi:hypothetical protein